ncbi:unnamed protein product [Spirodela intermedia]|uniref:Uncharacterized protein n=1 Tax=Spirodela intermedia TaxID=51605 RepID=A0A7I8K3I7_SPIIN|nr:unnamed protein product [Spirodela intermedia]
MRTRFLSKDYFFADGVVESLRGFAFLTLPAPCLPALHPPCAGGMFSYDLDICVDFPNGSTIDKFPFDRALSQFLSDVVPEVSSAGEQKSPRISAQNAGSEESGMVISQVHDRFVGCKGNESFEIIQFEIVEVDSFQREDIIPSKVDDEGIRFGTAGFGISVDVVFVEPFETIPYPKEVYDSTYLVENILVNSNLDRGGFHPAEDSCTFNGTLVGFNTLPRFEVREICFKHDKCPCSEAFNILVPYLKDDHVQGSENSAIPKDFNTQPIDYDILKYSSVKAPAEQIPDCIPISLNFIIDMDILSLKGNIFQVKGTALCPGESNGNYFQTPCLVSLQEVQILDLFTFDCFPMLGIAETVEDKETFNPKNNEDILPIESFYESVISSELCLVDDTFKSLPTPILCEDKKLTSLNLILDNILGAQRMHTVSASDGIYLDWHPLTEDTCNQKTCSTHINSLMTVQTYHIAPDMKLLEEESVDFYINILDDRFEVSDISENQKSPRKLNRSTLNTDKVLANCASSHILQTENKIEQKLRNQNTDRVSFLFGTMSQSNDLNFFVNARRGITSKTSSGDTEKQCTRGVAIPPSASAGTAALSDSAVVVVHHGNVEEHLAVLSDHILEIVRNIQKTYLAVLKNETDLQQNLHSFPVPEDLELLKFPTLKMMALVTKMSSENEGFLPLIGLGVMKQLAHFLCYFGIHTAHNYMRKISQESEYLKTRLSSTYYLVKDALRKAEKGHLESHPVLSIIEGILKRKTRQKREKTLIVAEKLFWYPLSRKLTSMKIKFHELVHSNDVVEHPDIRHQELRNSILEALPHSDCFIVSLEQVSETFPLNKFCHILEYGGCHASSRICNHTAKLVPSLQVDFIKVKLEDHADVVSFCEGGSQPPQYMMDIRSKYVTDLLKFSPSREIRNAVSSESANKVEATRDAESTSGGPYPNNTSANSSPSPETVIIVNIQNSEKEMLISRRSSYQKILETEKAGVQVVEREVDLPLDLILTASVCLIWYDIKNVRIAAAETEESSNISRFMETLATSILMSVSFAFSGCILIFEGESNFFEAVMEFSDALYAAAASLDIHFQLFCSYSPESTDEIVHGCIKNSGRINKEFLRWSLEERIQAVGKYQVPDESMTLFSYLCRYGELGESKSGTTECSSIDSDLSSGKVQFHCKGQRRSTSDAIKSPMDDRLHFRPQSNPDKDVFESSKQPNRFRMGDIFSMKGMLQRAGNHKNPGIDEVLGDKWDLKTSDSHILDQNGVGGCEHVCEDLNGEVINWNFDFLDDGFQSAGNNVDISRTETITGKSQLTSRYRYGSANNVFPPASDINCDDTWATMKHHYQVPEMKNIGRKNNAASKEDLLLVNRYGNFKRESYPHDLNILESAKRQKLMTNFCGNLFTNGNHMSREQEGSTSTADLLNRIKEKSKMKPKPLPSNTYFDRPGSSKNRDKCSLRRSPSTVDSYRYRGGCRQKTTSRQKCHRNIGKPLGPSKEKNPSAVMVPTWTPTDKRARLLNSHIEIFCPGICDWLSKVIADRETQILSSNKKNVIFYILNMWKDTKSVTQLALVRSTKEKNEVDMR